MLVSGSEKKTGFLGTPENEAGIPAAVTDTGCERDLNEDRYAVIESASGLTWVVCDGMGGVAGGELAAQLVIDAMRRDLETLAPRPLETALRGAIQEANRIIVLRRQNQAFAQMGTTIVAAMFNGPEVVVGHVGDSRAYLVRDQAIQQLTTDHTFVQELVEKGQIQPEEALTHPQAHVLTRAIGSEPALEVDLLKFWIWDVDPGENKDYLLLCTDGLYSLVSELEVAEIVSVETPQSACARLVELAKSRGGFDNITVAIIPLGGQLRLEPPPGYAGQIRKVKKLKKKRVETEPPSFWKVFLVVTVFSVLAALLVVLAIAYKLNT